MRARGHRRVVNKGKEEIRLDSSEIEKGEKREKDLNLKRG